MDLKLKTVLEKDEIDRRRFDTVFDFALSSALVNIKQLGAGKDEILYVQ